LALSRTVSEIWPVFRLLKTYIFPTLPPFNPKLENVFFELHPPHFVGRPPWQSVNYSC